ncbi:MAG TPA: hypothetical protein DIS93_14280 [Bdellovibrionales bacterium]|nr:hypothetical protein [Bdellovibrionales bacterium]
MRLFHCIFIMSLVPAAFAETIELQPCASVQLLQPVQPAFTKSELKLLCGDRNTAAWKSIPPEQARYFLKIFLEERGYHHPVFSISDKTVHIKPGALTRVQQLSETGSPVPLGLERLRKVKGEVMTPAFLDRIERWATRQLQNQGYPCPKLKVLADPSTGIIEVSVNAGEKKNFSVVQENGIPGIKAGFLRRYDAFRLGEPFEKDLLIITENRVISENLLSGFHLSESCEDEALVIRQEGFAGPPRLLRLGFGINTEGILVNRTSWRNARLGTRGSSAEMTLYASAREQRLESVLNWYHLPHPSRRSVRPQLQWTHQNERLFETMELRAQAAYATSWDGAHFSLVAFAGPALSEVRTFRGPSVGNSHFLALDGTGILKSHDFEYFASDPRSGFSLQYGMSLSDQSLLSSASVQRYSVRGEYLLNAGAYEPPLWIVGFRAGFGTTVTEDQDFQHSAIPANYFQYLGGSANLRGFGRQELPFAGTRLSSAFFDFEARLSHVLPFALEPLVFFDLGALSASSWSLDAPVYRSPGVGLRWASPVGIVRTTLAYGSPADDSGQWQFYFSLGEEF